MDEFEELTDAIYDIPEYRFTEFREVEGRTIHGVLLRYGDIGRTPYGAKEVFMPGAFGDVDTLDSILHFQHDRARPLARTGGGGLTLTDSPETLLIAAEMPDTQDGNDALELVQKRILRGFSMEFNARRERYSGDTRIIESAALPGAGLVDKPAYPQSVIMEVRAAGNGISGEFKYDTDTVLSSSGKVRKQRIRPGAFTFAINAPDREINLVLGDSSRPLASKQAGSLELEDTPTALKFRVKQLPKTSYARDFLGLLRAGSIAPGIIPLFQRTPKHVDANADYEEEESKGSGTYRRVVRNGLLTALSVLFRPPRGNPGSLFSIFGRRPQKPRPSVFTRPRRMVGGVSDGEQVVKPKAGDIIRGGRVIRMVDGKRTDVGPALRQLWL